jgi:hypothetical protein
VPELAPHPLVLEFKVRRAVDDRLRTVRWADTETKLVLLLNALLRFGLTHARSLRAALARLKSPQAPEPGGGTRRQPPDQPRASAESPLWDFLLLPASVRYVIRKACRDAESACCGGHDDGQPEAG